VRPTSDRLRETLFNVISGRVEGQRFLDLCAGSGAVGIEALSRGAQHVTFVDNARKMGALIKSNLELCRITPNEAQVFVSDVLTFLRVATKSRAVTSWDLVFFDPPYAYDYLPVLKFFGSHSAVLNPDGLLIVEHSSKTTLPETLESLNRTRVLKQGDSSLSFYTTAPGRSKT
jgi:16S rRNA (guanine966-N2)-methyltransferase